jgi:hypothetical protein
MVTAELAAAMPVIAGLTVLAVGAIGVGIDQVRCVDAARIGARALARGDPVGAVTSAARAAAPSGATIALGGDGESVTVTIGVTRGLPGGLGAFRLGSSSTAAREVVTP